MHDGLASAPDFTGPDATVATGIKSLDYILNGGFSRNSTHLIEGRPGTGKSTLALQFLIEGRDAGEKCLFITFSEGADELHRVARSHGLSLHGIDIFDMLPLETLLDPDEGQSIVYAADLDLGATVKMVMERASALAPTRVVIASFSEIGVLAQEVYRYRRLVLALQNFFSSQNCTVLLLEDQSEQTDLSLEGLAPFILRLEQVTMDYGVDRRRLRVVKMRGRPFHGGSHDFVIRRGGLRIFPRLVASDHPGVAITGVPALSGIAALDDMVGGGLDRGTTTLIRGPAGAGKSALALQLVMTALARGEKAIFISFDETRRNFERRAETMSLAVEKDLASGDLVFLRVDPAELSPGQLSDMIRRRVEDGYGVVVLDSLSGYQHAMATETNLMLHLHELLIYLNQQAVLTILTLAQTEKHGVGNSPIDVTYLADTVLLLRFLEADGDIKRSISVLKKRTGPHQHGMRELRLDSTGIRIGSALSGFSSLLSDTPIYHGGDSFLENRPPLLRN